MLHMLFAITLFVDAVHGYSYEAHMKQIIEEVELENTQLIGTSHCIHSCYVIDHYENPSEAEDLLKHSPLTLSVCNLMTKLYMCH